MGGKEEETFFQFVCFLIDVRFRSASAMSTHTRVSSREDAIAQGQGNFVAVARKGINQYHSQG
jgi:MFS superfamily sulfate permease-like transporter